MPRQEKIQKFQIIVKYKKIFVIFLGILIQLPAELVPNEPNYDGLEELMIKNNEIKESVCLKEPTVE
jgi:hypothetical protein